VEIRRFPPGRLDSHLPGRFHGGTQNKPRQADKQRHSFAARPSGVHQQEHSMPKMKTKKSAAKRFRVRPGGTVKRGQAFKRHILTKKTTKNKRHLRGAVNVHETNMGHMAQMLPFAGL
jgi:large subunit ribosomal protein L35